MSHTQHCTSHGSTRTTHTHTHTNSSRPSSDAPLLMPFATHSRIPASASQRIPSSGHPPEEISAAPAVRQLWTWTQSLALRSIALVHPIGIASHCRIASSAAVKREGCRPKKGWDRTSMPLLPLVPLWLPCRLTLRPSVPPSLLLLCPYQYPHPYPCIHIHIHTSISTSISPSISVTNYHIHGFTARRYSSMKSSSRDSEQTAQPTMTG